MGGKMKCHECGAEISQATDSTVLCVTMDGRAICPTCLHLAKIDSELRKLDDFLGIVRGDLHVLIDALKQLQANQKES
jgi:hypothetical protein